MTLTDALLAAGSILAVLLAARLGYMWGYSDAAEELMAKLEQAMRLHAPSSTTTAEDEGGLRARAPGR